MASKAGQLIALRPFFAALTQYLATQTPHRKRVIPHLHTVSIPASTGDYTSWPDWPLWHCTMLHESGGHWDFQTANYAGAFAIARTTWRAYAGEYAARYPNAALAPPDAQILGARLVRAHVGSRLWGGLRVCGG